MQCGAEVRLWELGRLARKGGGGLLERPGERTRVLVCVLARDAGRPGEHAGGRAVLGGAARKDAREGHVAAREAVEHLLHHGVYSEERVLRVVAVAACEGCGWRRASGLDRGRGRDGGPGEQVHAQAAAARTDVVRADADAHHVRGVAELELAVLDAPEPGRHNRGTVGNASGGSPAATGRGAVRPQSAEMDYFACSAPRGGCEGRARTGSVSCLPRSQTPGLRKTRTRPRRPSSAASARRRSPLRANRLISAGVGPFQQAWLADCLHRLNIDTCLGRQVIDSDLLARTRHERTELRPPHRFCDGIAQE